MTGALHEIPAGDKVPDVINAVIETPRGARVRYAFDTEMSAFRLVSHLTGGDGYPADYGFVPSTSSADGHPLDIFVLCEDPTFPGCVVECRPVGVIHLTDGRIRDSKIIAAPCFDARADGVRCLADVPQGTRDAVQRLFELHRHISGREQDVEGWGDAEEALDVVFKAWEGFLI